jgi:hypothetical protein
MRCQTVGLRDLEDALRRTVVNDVLGMAVMMAPLAVMMVLVALALRARLRRQVKWTEDDGSGWRYDDASVVREAEPFEVLPTFQDHHHHHGGWDAGHHGGGHDGGFTGGHH